MKTPSKKKGYAVITKAKGKQPFHVREVKGANILGSTEKYSKWMGCIKNIVAKLNMYGGEKVLVNDKTAHTGLLKGVNWLWVYKNGTFSAAS